ncbi:MULTISPECIES: hypothetical protein [Luteimonas]|uniref:hypothetical protein n=1 Tax=Luteimonas TaxID=83614 RepID=UPI000C7AFC0E|nr:MULTISPECIES: hypothetical protein [Luteimonas]
MNACDLFDPARLPARDEDGRLTHPDIRLVVFVEDEVDVAPFFNGAGLELRSVAHEWPEDDHDGVDLSWVTPEPPEGDDWRLVSIHDNEDGEAIVWWTRYIGPASSTARIVRARMIDGVHVIVAQPASRLLPDQLLVRYDDYLAATKPAAVAGDESAAFDAWFRSEQGKEYDGMWSFARAAWMHRAALSAAPAAPIPTPQQISDYLAMCERIGQKVAARAPVAGDAVAALPLPDSFARVCSDGYWLLRVNGTERFDVHDPRYTSAQEVYSAEQMRAYADAARAQDGASQAGAARGVPDAVQCDQIVVTDWTGPRKCSFNAMPGDTLCKRHRATAAATGYAAAPMPAEEREVRRD